MTTRQELKAIHAECEKRIGVLATAKIVNQIAGWISIERATDAELEPLAAALREAKTVQAQLADVHSALAGIADKVYDRA